MRRSIHCVAALAILAGAPATAQHARLASAAATPAADDLLEAYFELEDEYDEAYDERRVAARAAFEAYRAAAEEEITMVPPGPPRLVGMRLAASRATR